MGKTNKEVIQEFFEVVINGKDLDAIPNYFAEDYRSRLASYVGLGLYFDQGIEDRVLVRSVAKGGPSDGKLLPGDVLVSAQDEKRKWETLEEIRAGSWGQGVIGTNVTLNVERNGEEVAVPVTRGKVEGFEFTLQETIDSIKHWLSVGCPDLKSEILHIVAEGDLVAVHAMYTGTVSEYKRQAIWVGMEIDRMKDGKIVESWEVGPELSYFTQLGFKVEPPVT